MCMERQPAKSGRITLYEHLCLYDVNTCIYKYIRVCRQSLQRRRFVDMNIMGLGVEWYFDGLESFRGED